MESSVLNKQVSLRRHLDSSEPTRRVNLLDVLQYRGSSDRLSIMVQDIRECGDPEEQLSLKLKAPVFSVSGVFEPSFSRKNLVEHSGLICLDIDQKDNPRITDWQTLKADLRNIRFVAYAGLSIRGNGLFLIVPILYHNKHEEHFDALSFFFSAIGLTIDQSCKNINRLRFYSTDEAAYYNHNAESFNLFLPGTIDNYKITVKENQEQIKTINKPVSGKLSPLDDYNLRGDAQNVLLAHGWKLRGKKGSNIEFVRPGKKSGGSAHYNVEYRKLYLFSSDPSTGFPNASQPGEKPYSNVDIRFYLERHPSINALASVLKREGYGR